MDTWVLVAEVRWDAHVEQDKLAELFRSHNIRMTVEGSVLYSVMVPKLQVARAIELLSTNQLVLDGRVRLFR